MEFTLYFDRPSVIAPMDLKYGLPCSDFLWEAATADQWLAHLSEHDFANDLQHAASDILQYRQQRPAFWRTLRRSSYASLVWYVGMKTCLNMTADLTEMVPSAQILRIAR